MQNNQSSILAAIQPGEVRSPVIDLTQGGQNGFMPVPFEWASNGSYVQQQVRPFLIVPPGLFQYATNPQREVDILKAMIELWPTKIDGLNSTVTNEHGASTPIGNAGEVLESITNSMRAASKPSYGYGLDKINQTIVRYWTEYSRMYIMDPDLKVPGIVQSPKYIAAGSPVITPADCSFVVLYVEPDSTLTRPVKVWLTSNHQPTGDLGDLKGYAERGQALQTVDVNIEFTGYTQSGQAPLLFGQSVLNAINLVDLRPLELGGITSFVDPRVLASNLGSITNVSPSVMPPSSIGVAG